MAAFTCSWGKMWTVLWRAWERERKEVDVREEDATPAEWQH